MRSEGCQKMTRPKKKKKAYARLTVRPSEWKNNFKFCHLLSLDLACCIFSYRSHVYPKKRKEEEKREEEEEDDRTGEGGCLCIHFCKQPAGCKRGRN